MDGNVEKKKKKNALKTTTKTTRNMQLACDAGCWPTTKISHVTKVQRMINN